MAKTSEPKVVTLTSPLAIRALAHPARMTVIDALYARRTPMTATELAEIAGLSPSAMSYHLRSLEKHGAVLRAPKTRDGREQPWVRAGASLQVNPGHTSSSRATQSATSVLIAAAMDRDRETIMEVLQRKLTEDESNPLDEVATYMRNNLVVNVAEAKKLARALEALIKPYLEESRTKAPAGTSRMIMSVLLAPNPRD